MILFAILKFLLWIGINISNLIGQLGSPTFDFSWSDDFINLIDVALYLIPLAKLEPLLICIFIYINFRIIRAFIKMLLSIVPGLGG